MKNYQKIPQILIFQFEIVIQHLLYFVSKNGISYEVSY